MGALKTNLIFITWTIGSIFSMGVKASEISLRGPEGVQNLQNVQQEHYKKNQWSKFFAYALYYRKQMLSTPKKLEAYYRPKLFALEVMAYAKHCQWKQVNSLLRRFEAREDQLKKDLGIKRLKEKVDLLEVYQMPAKENEEQGDDTDKILWPLEHTDVQKVKHPKRLRLKVKNRCS